MTSLEEALETMIRDIVRSELERWQQQNQSPTRLAYTVKEAAELSGASAYDLRRAITAGELTARKAGEGQTGKYLIPLDCLQAWLHGQKQPCAPQKRRAAR